MWTQRLTAMLVLAVPLWCQRFDAAREVQRIQAELLSAEVIGDANADQERRSGDFARMQTIVSDYVVAQVAAEPDINWWELRSRLIQILGGKHDERLGPENPFRDPPYVFLRDPVLRKTGPVVFSVVYNGYTCPGSGCARIVVESYVLDKGRARLSGRGGSELNGIEGGAQQVGTDELLIQGQLTWASGHVLPFKAVLYRVNETGVKTVWQAPATPGLSAAVFGGYLLVQYHDESRDNGLNAPGRLDMYSLESGVPELVFHRED